MRLVNVYNVALITSLFPWVSFGIFEGGIQPFYILTMAISIFAHIVLSKRIGFEYVLFLFPILFILFNSFSSEISRSEFIREVVAYFSMAMSFVFFNNYIRLFGFPKKIISYSIVIWLVAGVLQVFFGEKIFEYIVHARTTSGRGVTGFSSEPGYYGMHLALLVSLLLLSSSERFMKPILFVTSGLVLSASVVAGYFYVLFISSVLISKKILTLKVSLTILILGICAYFFILIDMRFGQIISLFYNSGIEGLYSQDSSANARISQTITPFILSYYNYFLPATDSIISQVGEIDEASFLRNFLSNDNKIGSYFGRIVFHFGFFFIIPLVFFMFVYLRKSIRQSLAILMIFLGLLPAISPAYPVVIYFLAYFIYLNPISYCSKKMTR